MLAFCSMIKWSHMWCFPREEEALPGPEKWGRFKWNRECESESRSVVSDSLWPRGLYSPWDSPGQNTGVGSLSLLQGIFTTQESNPGLPHCRQILHQLSHKGSPKTLEWVAYPFSSESSWCRNWTGGLLHCRRIWHKGKNFIGDIAVIGQRSPTFLAPGTNIMEDNFSTDWGWEGWFQDDSSSLHL